MKDKHIQNALKKLRKAIRKEARKNNEFFKKLRETDWEALNENQKGGE